MSRSRALAAAILIVAAGAANAALLPEKLGSSVRGQVKDLNLYDPELSQELGFEAGEVADYTTTDGRKSKITAWRFKDPTSAYTFHLLQRTNTPAAIRHGNYVLLLEGAPLPDTPPAFPPAKLPKLDRSGIPNLEPYLPGDGMVPDSVRYAIGPVSLAKFEPRIPPGVAGFGYGAEGQIARYRDGSTLTIFNYPTPSMARERAEEFRKIPGAVVKRAGPLAAVVLGAPDTGAADRLLGKVRYQAQVSWNEAPPGFDLRVMSQGIVTMILLALFICGLCIVGGLIVGGFLIARHRNEKPGETGTMIRLDLG